MPEEKPDPMRLPARERPDPRDQQPTHRPGEPGLQGGPAGAGSSGGTGGSRG